MLQVRQTSVRFYGVMVSTLDFESSDPSSNLGRTFMQRSVLAYTIHFNILRLPCRMPLWRNGLARWTSNSEVVGSNPISGVF